MSPVIRPRGDIVSQTLLKPHTGEICDHLRRKVAEVDVWIGLFGVLEEEVVLLSLVLLLSRGWVRIVIIRETGSGIENSGIWVRVVATIDGIHARLASDAPCTFERHHDLVVVFL